jgi:transitional endoplasmic reticulum ATPase
VAEERNAKSIEAQSEGKTPDTSEQGNELKPNGSLEYLKYLIDRLDKSFAEQLTKIFTNPCSEIILDEPFISRSGKMPKAFDEATTSSDLGERPEKAETTTMSSHSVSTPSEHGIGGNSQNIMAEATTKKKLTHVAIERSGERIVIPKSVSLDDALASLRYQRDKEEQPQAFSSPIERAFIFDACHALYVVLDRLFGYVQHINTPGFFGDTPPRMLKVPIDRDEVIQVPWGRMTLPGIEGYIETSHRWGASGRAELVIAGEVKGKHMDTINQIVESTRREVRENSIYKGKAFRIRFTDDSGEKIALPEPTFLDVDKIKIEELIFSKDVFNQVETSIFTPLKYTEQCRKHGIPLKRGILLTGPFGTGKTLTATVTAKLARENGWTFILCENPNEFAAVMDFAMEYGPSVVFCEDVDRVVSGNRDQDMDDILNTIDGVQSKGVEMMVVLTTNDHDAINKAMLRPGRLDAVIHVGPPDAEAVQKLVRLYARELLDGTEDLAEVGLALNGQIPAVIRETVERAKLEAIAITGGASQMLTSEALCRASKSMELQLALLRPQFNDPRSNIEKAADTIAAAINDSPHKGVAEVTAATVPVLADAVGAA